MFFLTNWVLTQPIKGNSYLYKISNVSSMDYRFKILDKIAKVATENLIHYKFIVLKNKKIIKVIILK